jgi:uncharacterized RmlC-like cupin family protein
VLQLEVPINPVIVPHTHSKPETLTILSGSIHHGHGCTLDKAKGATLKVSGFVYLPEDMPHSLWTTDEPGERQVDGSHPFGLNYIDLADDPSRPSGEKG